MPIATRIRISIAPPPLPLLPELRLDREADVEKSAGAADDEFADQRDDADEDGGDDQELDVAIADMGQFVGEHRLELGVVERIHQPAGDGDRILLLADAAGEGVPLRGFDDAERRHGDAAADAEIFEEVPEPRLGSSARPAARR